MIKWIVGGLVVALLFKRNATPNAVTNAAGAPPEGNISTWANSGSTSIGSVDAGRSSGQFGATENKSPIHALPPVTYKPTLANFSTRGFYLQDTYGVPGR